jgi:hypothetical protein
MTEISLKRISRIEKLILCADQIYDQTFTQDQG